MILQRKSAALLLFPFLICQSHAAQDTSKLPEAMAAKVLSAPPPEYPHEARRQQITGSGIVVIDVNTATGEVTRAYMAPSTGSPILDNATLFAFRRWRFAPGTVAHLRAPITFTLWGGIPSTGYVVKSKPMDDVLAAFLGKGTVLKGPIPAYPRFRPWTDKHGKGIYELHAGSDGKVARVDILKSSGDPTFDSEAVKTLAKWRLRRGPLVLELPLSFTLTPTNYSVDVSR